MFTMNTYFEHLCYCDFVTSEITYDRALDGGERLRNEDERREHIGRRSPLRLDPDRPPIQFRYAIDLVHGPSDSAVGPPARDALLTPALYRSLGPPGVVRAFPFGNEYLMYTEANFKGLKLCPNAKFQPFLKNFTREYYRFPDVPVFVDHESAGERTLRLDQRPADVRREDTGLRAADANVSVTVHVDRSPSTADCPDPKPRRVVTNVHLLDQTFVYENHMTIACSVAYRAKYLSPVMAEFTVPRLRGRAYAAYEFKEYAFKVPYDGMFYAFVLRFRKPNRRHGGTVRQAIDRFRNRIVDGYNDDDDDDDDDVLGRDCYTLRIECRAVIDFDTFARISTVILDFYAYQHRLYNGQIDEFMNDGPKWMDFRSGVRDGVRRSIDVMGPLVFCGSFNRANMPGNMYDAFAGYMGLWLMSDKNKRLQLQIAVPTDQVIPIQSFQPQSREQIRE